jgi:hypothetical protein
MRRLSLVVLLLAGLALPVSVSVGYATNSGDEGGGGACDYRYGADSFGGAEHQAWCAGSFETGWRGTVNHAPNCQIDKYMARVYALPSWEERFRTIFCADGFWHWSNAWPNNEQRASYMNTYCSPCAWDIMMLRR